MNKIIKYNTIEYVYHYTSLPTLLKILDTYNPKDNTISLWASDVSYMNDTSEMKYGISEAIEYIGKLEKENKSRKVLKLSSRLKEMDINLFLRNNGPFYSISFSSDGDSLPLWNLYSDKGHGVNLKFFNEKHNFKFKEEVVSNHFVLKDLSTVVRGISAVPIEYGYIRDKSAIANIIHELYNDYLNIAEKSSEAIKIANKFATMLICGGMYVKHSGYKYENELRIYGKSKDKREFRTNISGDIIPYVKIPLNVNHLRGITLGPTCKESNKNALEEFLRVKGINDIEIT